MPPIPPVIRVFEDYAEEYDSWYSRNPVVFENEVKAIKTLNLKGRGLEVGVGSGVFAARLKVEVGLDPARNMLLLARKRGVEVVRAVGEAMPFKDGCFDYVLMVVTLCFLERVKEVLREVWRVLKRKGIFCNCIVPLNSRWGRFYSRRKDSVFYRFARFYTVEEAKRLMEHSGFKVTGYSATLSFGPLDPPKPEEPIGEYRGRGFVCLKAVKTLC